jgi:high affinity sulfate transporter 1
MSDNASGVIAGIRWPRPFVGLRGVTAADLPREVSAGITLAALMIPLNIGYAQVAGLPPVTGLYAAIIPLAVFALLASSRHLVTSPDASMAGLVGAALVAFAAPGDPMRLQYALALAVVCGLLFLVFWVFRLAFLANFLSRAVMAGFITGLGVEVFTSQVRKILAAPHAAEAASGVLAAAERLKDAMATSVNTEGYFVEVVALIHSIPRANLYSVAIGVSAFVIVRLMKRYAPRIPGALVALVLLTLAVVVFDLPAKGVGVLGAIPSGAPTLTLPAIPLADYLRLLPSALAIVAILLCEGLLVVRSYSSKYNYKADGDQMLFAWGTANLAAGFTGSLLTGNSPSRSAAMDASGSRSQLPSLVAAVTIAIVLLFFTDLLAFLPNAALAGIVANAVLSLIEVHEFRELWRMRRSEFWIAAVCLVSVLALGPLRAVAIAFLLSTIDVIRRASNPDTAALAEAPDGSHFVPLDAAQASGLPGLVAYRFGAPLYFANATRFLDDVERLVTQATPPARWFVLDAQAMVDVDTTGAGVLGQAITMLKKRNITFAVSRADRSFRSWMEQYELMKLIDQQRFYPTNRHAAAAFRREAAHPDMAGRTPDSERGQ